MVRQWRKGSTRLQLPNLLQRIYLWEGGSLGRYNQDFVPELGKNGKRFSML